MATYKEFGNLTTAQIREIDIAIQAGRTPAQLARKYGIPAKLINEAMVMRQTRREQRARRALGLGPEWIDLGMADENGLVLR